MQGKTKEGERNVWIIFACYLTIINKASNIRRLSLIKWWCIMQSSVSCVAVWAAAKLDNSSPNNTSIWKNTRIQTQMHVNCNCNLHSCFPFILKQRTPCFHFLFTTLFSGWVHRYSSTRELRFSGILNSVLLIQTLTRGNRNQNFKQLELCTYWLKIELHSPYNGRRQKTTPEFQEHLDQRRIAPKPEIISLLTDTNKFSAWLSTHPPFFLWQTFLKIRDYPN
jgi:hypothetical protein